MTDAAAVTAPAGSEAPSRAAWALVAAPVVFVGGWAVMGATWSTYSPRRQAISDLAAVDSPRRWPMFVVFVAYGVLMVIGSQALRRSSVRLAWPAAAVNGLALIGVALFPIHRSTFIDDRHGNAALIAYLSIAALPVLAARGLTRTGHGWAAIASIVAGVASILFLASAYGNDYVGALQRTGAGIGDMWTFVAGVVLLRRRSA
ncbi:DUF998 domain-containing protein [Aquihabitans sp. G128]|uniref:DUF998 domain-containing protein n=1 Tax=Aquihabitans sp. G128 TaxID=2849779 RepID=UPI001C243DEC|nr:DUF998 domain-containing protein [Aquihabitans sp. G128]QXC61557.1 DUF998 domain-containing protein [Aquihabitans sp. G128]